MNKPLDVAELEALQKEFPVVDPTPVKLTRAQKLERLAELIEKRAARDYLMLAPGLEYYSPQILAALPAHGALELAAWDDVFNKDGLKNRSVLGVRDYLELSTPELHEFSCDCGGLISNADMASRIRRLAGSPPARAQRGGMFGRLAAGLGY